MTNVCVPDWSAAVYSFYGCKGSWKLDLPLLPRCLKTLLRGNYQGKLGKFSEQYDFVFEYEICNLFSHWLDSYMYVYVCMHIIQICL